MDSLHSNGLELELSTRRLSGPLIPGRHPRLWIAIATEAPAVALVVGLVVAPALYTVWLAAWTSPRSAVGCGLLVCAALVPPVLARYRGPHGFHWPPTRIAVETGIGVVLIAAAGLWLIGVELPSDGVWAYLRTGGWVAFAVLLAMVALGIAWYTRKLRWWWQPVIVPFGISAFTAGLAFRLLFEWLTKNRDLGGVATYRLAFEIMLGTAFLWTWLGLLTGLFRAAIHAVEADPVRAANLYGDTGLDRWKRLWQLVKPVWLIAFLVVGVAAARVFDAILVAVPRSMQYHIDSATVYWWRTSTTCTAPCGAAASYALPLAVIIGLAAVSAQSGIRAHRTSWSSPVFPERETGRRRIGFLPGMLAALLALASSVPILGLIVVALRGSALTRITHDAALWRALATTAWVATLATVIVLLVAVPVARRLAVVHSARAALIVVPALVILTVMPAQMYLGPLHEWISSLGLSGTRVPLILTHAAAGLPISLLILRGALLAPAYTPAADALYGLAPPGVILTRVLRVAGPALGAVAVLEFIQVWNDFFIGLSISGAGASPWSLLLWDDARQFDENSAQLAARALVSAVVPVILLLGFWRRWLVPGLTGGALR
ncbi:MAG: hypothetical protein JWN03_7547 [Nocardia sp.]|uniref:hypothetical protein n=1 Tax=Nocardia sp. TaxID=1821 RepID=UPI0026042027|nr:hypothetical protein [Nocardia sp.]MCU1647272.1 hypothetical protein [Nocardia sp.]